MTANSKARVAVPVRPLGFLLGIASATLLGCVILHPVLPLTPGGDLTLIHATRRWYPVHVGLLFATGGIIVGIWGPALAAAREVRAIALVAAALLALGQTLNGVNIAFMLGAATEYARLYQGGAGEVAVAYHAGHLGVVMAGRLGALLVSASAAIWAWLGAGTPSEPRPLRWLAALAALGGIVGAALAPPGHPLMLTAIGVMAVWGVAVGARLASGSYPAGEG